MQLKLRGKKQIYLEIVDEINKFINIGVIVVGERLPSVRQLAKDLGINPNTVDRAYEELERSGVIITLPNKGSFVQEKSLASDNKPFIDEIRQLKDSGASKEDLLIAIEITFKENN